MTNTPQKPQEKALKITQKQISEAAKNQYGHGTTYWHGVKMDAFRQGAKWMLNVSKDHLTTLRTKLETMEVENKELKEKIESGELAFSQVFGAYNKQSEQIDALKQKADKWDQHKNLIQKLLAGIDVKNAAKFLAGEITVQEYKAIELKNLKNPE